MRVGATRNGAGPIQSRRLRVLHFPDWRSGNPYQALLATELARTGVEVIFSQYVGAWFPLYRNARRHRADLLHLHWIADIIGANERNTLKLAAKQILFRLDLALVRRALRGRLLWTVHNLKAHECRNPTADRSARRVLARSAARLLVHGPRGKAAVVEAYDVPEERVAIVPMGNYLGQYPNGVGREQSRQRLGIASDRFVFLYLGSLRPYKGIEDLLDAFGQLSEPQRHLIIAGGGPDPGYLNAIRKRASSERILFEGRFIADDELQLFFNAADVVVLPFRDVFMSASLLLAMGFGRMVVAPHIGSIPDYADSGSNLLYSPERTDALREALSQAMASRDVEACGSRNLLRMQQLSWTRTAELTAELYSSVAQQ